LPRHTRALERFRELTPKTPFDQGHLGTTTGLPQIDAAQPLAALLPNPPFGMPALDQPSHEAYAWDSGSLAQDIINSPLGQDIIKALNVASIPARVSGEGAINFFMREFVDPFHAPEDRTTTLLQNSVAEFTQEHGRTPNLLEFTDLSDRAIKLPWGVRGAVQAAVDPLNVGLPGLGPVLGLGKGVPKIVAKQALNRMPTQAPVRGAGGAIREEVTRQTPTRRPPVGGGSEDTDLDIAIREILGHGDIEPPFLQVPGEVRTGIIPQLPEGTVKIQRVQNLSKDVPAMDRLKDLLRRGLEMGGRGFYNTEPLRRALVAALGEDEGHRQFMEYIGMVGATSPGAKVEANIGIASFYRRLSGPITAGMSKDDQKMVDLINQVTRLSKGEELPLKGYGHKFKRTHARNVLHYIMGDWDDAQRIGQPKVRRFLASLLGHPTAVPIDIHAMRIMGMVSSKKLDWLGTFQVISDDALEQLKGIPNEWRMGFKYGTDEAGRPNGIHLRDYIRVGKDGKTEFNAWQAVKDGVVHINDIEHIPSVYRQTPGENEYRHAEALYTRLAKEVGEEIGEEILPHQAQASIWLAGAGATGVESTSLGTFMSIFRARIHSTAKARKVSPYKILHEFLAERGLLSFLVGLTGGVVAEKTMGATPTPDTGDDKVRDMGAQVPPALVKDLG
jgi:hypothetical protein